MENSIEKKKGQAQGEIEDFRKKMDEIVRQEREAGNMRLEQLKIDVDEYLKKISQESDARVFQNKLNAISRLIENHKKNLEEMNPNWPPDLQNKARKAFEILLNKGIQDIMDQKFDLEKAKQEYFPDSPKSS
ncbi:MAG: hypothetical protein NT170_00130 [Candidatus Moranbacteria bacterium]|nr:hypothetical protein [Candidatus Moranbacteria bacterium]